MKLNTVRLLIAPAAFVVAALLSTGAHAQDAIDFLDSAGSNHVTVTYRAGAFSWISADVAAGDYNFSVNGQNARGFSSDVYDSMRTGETWTGTRSYTSTGLPQAWYARSNTPVNAIDSIVEKYDGVSNSAIRTDAQLAIWDLSVGGGVQKFGGLYFWSASFWATGDDPGVYNAMSQTTLSDIYNIEQQSLRMTGPSNSIFESVDTYSYRDHTRPEDLAFSSFDAQPFVTPEVSSVGAWAGVFAISSLALLRRRRA